MTLPGMPGSQVSNDGDIMRIIADLQRQVRELAAQNVLATAGITTQTNGLTVAGALNVNGPMAVTGTLSLPAGIIGNDALASPITIDQASNSAIGFAVSTTATPQAATSISVPAGFSRAYIFALCNVGSFGTSTGDYVYSTTVIQGVASRQVKVYAASSSVSVTTGKSSVLTGLNGGTISVAANIWADTQRSANPENRAYVEAQAIFLR